MSMTDPIADMITRIRNACKNQKRTVAFPFSKEKQRIGTVLRDSGFTFDQQVRSEGAAREIILNLKYGPNNEDVIHHIRRVSTPGRRIYVGRKGIRAVLSGLGIGIISTSKGVLSDKECRRQNLGGEYLIEVW